MGIEHLRFVLQADVSDDEIVEWYDFAAGPGVAQLLLCVDEIPKGCYPYRIVDTVEQVVVATEQAGVWTIDYDGLSDVAPRINYTAFALSLLD